MREGEEEKEGEGEKKGEGEELHIGGVHSHEKFLLFSAHFVDFGGVADLFFEGGRKC